MSSEPSRPFSSAGLDSAGSLKPVCAPASTTNKSPAFCEESVQSDQRCSRDSGSSTRSSSLLQPASFSQLQTRLRTETRECKECHRTLPVEVFAKHGDYLNRVCNSCRGRRDRGSPLVRQKRALIAAAKSEPCHDCGVSFPAVCMSFERVRGEPMAHILETACRWLSIERLKQELSNHDLVCACCQLKRRGSKRRSLAKSARETREVEAQVPAASPSLPLGPSAAA
jgi:hypothetical protein